MAGNIDQSEMERQLRGWADTFWGRTVVIDDVVDMSGHSGKVLAFKVIVDDVTYPLVVRLAPEGVPHKGSTDVLRQVPLLNALHGQGIKVPAVVDSSGDTRFFGVPYLVMERLPGKPLMMGPDAGQPWLPGAYRQRAHNLAAELLASLHRFDVDRYLPDWETPKSVNDELEMWTGILHKGKDDTWIAQGTEVLQSLQKRAPSSYAVGLTHGDFQTNNVLYSLDDENLSTTGIVDWEIANVGPTALDLAWFLMMNDEKAWHPVEQRGGLNLEEIVSVYQDAVGSKVEHLNWFRALACYRIASIATLNIRLHRTGRKHDPAWERAAQSVPIMFHRALELVNS